MNLLWDVAPFSDQRTILYLVVTELRVLSDRYSRRFSTIPNPSGGTPFGIWAETSGSKSTRGPGGSPNGGHHRLCSVSEQRSFSCQMNNSSIYHTINTLRCPGHSLLNRRCQSGLFAPPQTQRGPRKTIDIIFNYEKTYNADPMAPGPGYDDLICTDGELRLQCMDRDGVQTCSRELRARFDGWIASKITRPDWARQPIALCAADVHPRGPQLCPQLCLRLCLRLCIEALPFRAGVGHGRASMAHRWIRPRNHPPWER